MLGDHADDVIALAADPFRQAADRQVIALGGAAGEDDFPGPGAEGRRDRIPGLGHRLLGRPAEAVRGARRVAVGLREKGSMASSTRGSVRVVAWLSM